MSKRRVRILIQDVDGTKSLGGTYISTVILDKDTVYKEVKRLVERLENKAMNEKVQAEEAASTHGTS